MELDMSSGSVVSSLRNRREVRIFLASPSDCVVQRRIVRAIVQELNTSFCDILGLVVTVVGWEDVAPDLGHPQAVIDRQTPSYEILVGILWLRLGTPIAPGGESGTTHEINLARVRRQAGASPHIMLYFNVSPPSDMRALDIDQYSAVHQFRRSVESDALVRQFLSDEEFAERLRLDLQAVLRGFHDTTTNAGLSIRDNDPPREITLPTLAPKFFHTALVPRHPIMRPELEPVKERIVALEPSSKSALWAVIGIGGAGKSTAVRMLIRELEEKNVHFNGVFWYSFYEASAASAEEFFLEAIRYVSGGAVGPDAFNSAHQRKVALWDYLQRGRYVLVLDGLEYLQVYEPSSATHGQLRDRVLRDFLRGCALFPHSTVIVTSRIVLTDVLEHATHDTIQLGQYTLTQGCEYLRTSGLQGSNSEIERACEMFGCHPLSLRVLADYLGRYYAGAATAVDHIQIAETSAVAQRLDALFTSYWDRLDDDQRYFLSRLSALRVGAYDEDLDVLVRPTELGGPGDVQSPRFREAVARLEQTALLEVHERDRRRFYTAPVLLRMLAYDRMSGAERTKVHLEWVRYTEGVPRPSLPGNPEEAAPLVEMVYHSLKAGLFGHAWDIYSRNGKYKLSRVLIDLGAHELGVEIGEHIWEKRNEIFEHVTNPLDSKNELQAYYSTHLINSGRMATACTVIGSATPDSYGVPLCLRTRTLLLAGMYAKASKIHQDANGFQHSPYSWAWSSGLIKFFGSGASTSVEDLRHAVNTATVIVRGYLGLLYFDLIDALTASGQLEEAGQTLKEMHQVVVRDGHAEIAAAYLLLLRGELDRVRRRYSEARRCFVDAIAAVKKMGDVYGEAIGLLRLAHTALEASPDFSEEIEQSCKRTLLLCRDAGEGVLPFAYPHVAAQAYSVLARARRREGHSSGEARAIQSLEKIASAEENWFVQTALLEARERQ
jgi:hypothetical protein